MKTERAILSGILVWAMVFSLFIASSHVSIIEDSEIQQNLVVSIFLIPLTTLGAAIYYKKGEKTNGLNKY